MRGKGKTLRPSPDPARLKSIDASRSMGALFPDMDMIASCLAPTSNFRNRRSGILGKVQPRQVPSLRFWQLASALFLASFTGFADEIVVNDTSDGTLRNAITSANPGDVITFDSALSGQTIVLTGGALTISVNLTIDASDLAEGLCISGNGASRVFYINGAGDVVFKGFEIVNGFSGAGQDGGGIYIDEGSLTLIGMSLTGNATGGGIANQEPGDNGGAGGGIFNNSGTLILLNSTLSGNSTGEGASTVDIFNFPAGSGGNGGGICSLSGTLIIENSTISGNSCGRGRESIFAGSGGNGGGIYGTGSDLTIRNSTITANRSGHATVDNTGSAGSGGGLYLASGSLTLTNSIVAGNSLGNAGNSGPAFGPDIRPGSATLTPTGANLIGNNDQVTGVFPEGSLVGTSSTPLDPLLDPLSGLAKFPMVHVPMTGSPAIDAGVNTELSADGFDLDGDGNTVESLPIDQRGLDRTSGPAVDLGSVEDQTANLATRARLLREIRKTQIQLKKAKRAKEKTKVRSLRKKLSRLKFQLHHI